MNKENNLNDFETVPTRVHRAINELVSPYFKEEDWECLEPRLQDRLDEIFSDAAGLELRNELGFMHLVARMENKILSNRTFITANFIVTIFLIVLLFIWT